MPASGASTPTVFISYSWDNASHKEWVRKFAARLIGDGVKVKLDQWDAVPGDQLPEFMEREIRGNKYVIIICTPSYKRRADKRLGGVGYEGDIMTAEVSDNKSRRKQRKFIPVLRAGSWEQSAPSWIRGKYRIHLDDEPFSEENYQDLLSTLHDARPKPPPLGPRPQRYRIQRLIEDLKSTFADDRRHAADALGCIGPEAKAAVPILIATLKDGDDDVRSSAVDALGNIGPVAKAAIPALIAVLNDCEIEVRRSAASALRDICLAPEDAISVFIASLKNDDGYVRSSAVNALGNSGPKAKDVVPTLIATLKDSDVCVRMSVAAALGRIGLETEDVVPGLIATLQDGAGLVRKASVDALGNIGPQAKAAVPSLIGVLKDNVEDVRISAYDALRKVGTEVNEPIPPTSS